MMELVLELEKLRAIPICKEAEADILPYFVDGVWRLEWTRDKQIELLKTPLRKWYGWAVWKNVIPAWSMRWSDLRGSDLSGCNLRGCNLSGCNLRRSDLRGCNLRGCNLSGCNLRRSDLRGSDLSGANTANAIGLERKDESQ